MNLWLIPIFPLIGFLINGLFGKRLSKQVINIVAIGSVAASFAWVVWVISSLYPLEASHHEHYFTWFQSGVFNVAVDFFVDRLNAVMLLIITGIGLLIHIYAIGYMSHEGGYYRFFSYLNLFMFFMLVLVLAQNFLVMFVGWEGVGLCSYLLIGFYYHEQYATDAGNKAFIFNRVGDFGFSLGMLLLVTTFGTLDFFKLTGAAADKPVENQAGVLTVATLLLLLGATGKSAQVPLYVWLPDAMAGPTPVSALIHAATMVTAGVYMIARASFLFSHTPITMHVVALIGLLTAVMAALIGITQNDIKKVFAYSTVSQLGYMFLGLGVGAYSASIFHVMTHAFFKALLFLGAGSVIHALSGEQDLRHMGGLRKKLPITCWTLLAASLAISGFPLFSGFFSKDAILVAAYEQAPWMYVVGVLTAGVTAFYVFRAFFMAFWGEYRGHAHPHESPAVMTLPLIILAVGSIGGGFLNVPKWLAPMFPMAEHENLTLELLSAGVGIVGILVAAYFYVMRPGAAEAFGKSMGGLYTFINNKYYVDELYHNAIIRPALFISRAILWHGVDENGIDGNLVDGIGHRARDLGGALRYLQSGSIRNYGTWVLTGCLLVLLVIGLAGGAR
jgi:NADH-quinone oxidoreductase subunit L